MIAIMLLAGLGAGVLLNSLADNLPPDRLGQRHKPGRPRCHYCGARHAPAYWLALMSLLTLGGRCEHCGGPRPVRHVIVELITGLSLAYAWHWAAGSADGTFAATGRFLAAAVILSVFILIAVIDIEHRLILRVVALPAALILGLIGLLSPGRGVATTLLGGLGGYVSALAVFLLGQALSLAIARLRGRALGEVAFGGGDVNLAGVVGLTIGWPEVLRALFITVFASGAFSLGFMLLQMLRRRYRPFTPLPFGPFLILGALVVYFLP